MTALRRSLFLAAVGIMAGVFASHVAGHVGPAQVSWYVVESDSMEPTLPAGDRVGVAPVPATMDLRDGDIVVAASPKGGPLLLKRVVGTGGQTVAIEDAVLVVDGVAVDEPYVDHARIDGVYFGPVTVPPGQVFLMGDNRGRSVDSREFGAVPVTDVRGFVVQVRPGAGAGR